MTDRLAALADRQEIADLLHRYARAIDRCDGDLLRSVYWPEATDDHGAFKGTGEDFCNWVIPLLKGMGTTQHSISNILIELDGDTAWSECHVQAFHDLSTPDGGGEHWWVGGRYIDRCERRNGEWRIACRKFVMDWNRHDPPSHNWDDDMTRATLRGTKDRTDPLYTR